MTAELEPYVESRETIDFVDATPDGGYAIRILEAYRKRCDCLWFTSGLTTARTAVYMRMNEDQCKRADELDRAIARLREDAKRWRDLYGFLANLSRLLALPIGTDRESLKQALAAVESLQQQALEIDPWAGSIGPHAKDW